MMESLDNLDPHWVWLAIGLFLAAAEMAVPGVFLIWLAGAALVTGVLTWLLPLELAVQIVIFAVLAIVAVFSGRRYLRDNPIADADPLMNRRGARLVGETAVVTQAIDGGMGRVHHGDSEWLARGPDAAPGTRVRITGNDGAVLLVEPVAG
ncbi:NfeD family protein [Tsuneonella sp. CC-YZS046]|uniref:NfeD family protein n=1 Tax=Tsuneonella sp. CC-YZS046 TaxID=3042152 RepID=UPI002D79FB84|nr:NfeD family protein [Tsuneonella sp. CC-YZS046]WRO65729.1 NfeD family protein [Tsuneonella sp. CC-YZS046]